MPVSKKKLSPYKKEKIKKAVAIASAGIIGATALGAGSYYLYKKSKTKEIPVSLSKEEPIIQMEEIPAQRLMIETPKEVLIPEEDLKFLEQFNYALKKLKISHVEDYQRTYESFCIYYKKYKDFLDLHCKYSGNDKQKNACITRNLKDRYKIENIHKKATEIASRKCK